MVTFSQQQRGSVNSVVQQSDLITDSLWRGFDSEHPRPLLRIRRLVCSPRPRCRLNIGMLTWFSLVCPGRHGVASGCAGKHVQQYTEYELDCIRIALHFHTRILGILITYLGKRLDSLHSLFTFSLLFPSAVLQCTPHSPRQCLHNVPQKPSAHMPYSVPVTWESWS
jgi:hypothetical protein